MAYSPCLGQAGYVILGLTEHGEVQWTQPVITVSIRLVPETPWKTLGMGTSHQWLKFRDQAREGWAHAQVCSQEPSLCSWRDLCSHSWWCPHGLGYQRLVGMFSHQNSLELSLDGQLQLVAWGLTWGVQTDVWMCVACSPRMSYFVTTDYI